jgi:type IV secretory pathway VirB10-like protein
MMDEKPIPENETLASPVEAHPPSAQLRDVRATPEGVVPKQAQGYVIAGLSVLILMAVMFSKNHPQPAAKEALPPPQAMATGMNQRKIQELEQDLSADQRQSQSQSQQAQKTISGNAAPAGTPSPMQPNGTSAPMTQLPPPPTDPPCDPVADAEKALAFKARFASNLVAANDGASHSLAKATNRSEEMNAPLSRSSDLRPEAAAPQSGTSKRAPKVSVNSAHGQPYALFEGTTIDTALVNRLDGEFAGPVKVMVTNPVYSHDRQHVLIPEGTFILGDVQKVSGLGQKRLAVTFHRMLMPDGYSVDLDQFHGLDQVGDTGLKDQVNNHYLQIFGSSIALGVIAGAAQNTNANAGYNQSGSEAYRSGIASSLSQSSSNVLDRFINIPPTITIREGHRIKVYLTQDLLLPAYENHTVPGDL